MMHVAAARYDQDRFGIVFRASPRQVSLLSCSLPRAYRVSDGSRRWSEGCEIEEARGEQMWRTRVEWEADPPLPTP